MGGRDQGTTHQSSLQSELSYFQQLAHQYLLELKQARLIIHDLSSKNKLLKAHVTKLKQQLLVAVKHPQAIHANNQFASGKEGENLLRSKSHNLISPVIPEGVHNKISQEQDKNKKNQLSTPQPQKLRDPNTY